MSKPLVSVLYAPGTNSHHETMWAFEHVGAQAKLVFLKELLSGNQRLDECDVLCIPGGFAHGDHTGAGNLFGKYLRHDLSDQLTTISDKPVLAICNGFQVAVRAGMFGDGISLTINDAGTFRNIVHQPHVVQDDHRCVWLNGLEGRTLRFPCAHGEGRLVNTVSKPSWRAVLKYPASENPDGSADDTAGITSANGMMLGLMDHPERLPNEPGTLDIFANGVKAVR